MYKTIVSRRARSLYAAMNRGDSRPLLKSFGRDFAYTFVGGDHALAGTRRTPEAMAAQLDRVLRLFPGIHFTVREVIVNGPPWNTRIALTLGVHARLQDGSPYDNDIIQLLRMRWGRVYRVLTMIDTGRLTAAFDRLVAAGIGEAAASPVDAGQ